MPDEAPKVIVKETMTLKKFDGDDQTQEPVEVITIELENGVEVKRTIQRNGEIDNGTN